MSTNYLSAVAGLLLLCNFAQNTFAQPGPQFPNCGAPPLSLCINDPGVSLPQNNKYFIGEENPDATSCSVHLIQLMQVTSDCGTQFTYQVQLFLFDTSQPYILRPLTAIVGNIPDQILLSYDTETSPVNFIKTNGIPFNTGCQPYHRIRWVATDTCGGTHFCDQLISLYDCQPPLNVSPFFLSTVILDTAGQSIRLAEDFAPTLIDDCTYPPEYVYSFELGQYNPDTLFEYCDIPGLNIEVPLVFYYGDKGVDANCNGIVEWTERTRFADTANLIFLAPGLDIICYEYHTLSGHIETPLGEGIAKVIIHLESQEHVFPDTVTDQQGNFSIYLDTFDVAATLIPSRNDDYSNGVNTLDLIRIQKHLLNIEAFTAPYQYVEADANHNQSISVIDLIELRKLILGIYNELPNNKSWRFYPKDSISANPAHPWNYVETISMQTDTDIVADFIGLKIGDVNNSVDPHFQSDDAEARLNTIDFVVNDMSYHANDLIEIPLHIAQPGKISGLQFTLSSPDLEFIGVTSASLPIQNDEYALFGDKMSMSWFSLDQITQRENTPLLIINARAKRAGRLHTTLQLNSDVTRAEVYQHDEIYSAQLKFNEKVSASPVFPECNDEPISLCVNDPGVRLLSNNQIFLGVGDTTSTSCSVHITQTLKVQSDCGNQLQYEVQLFLDDTSAAYVLQPLTSVTTDSLLQAELSFNTELSPDAFIQTNGIPYSGGCQPYHRIKWTVTDTCGNVTECNQLIHFYDCQPPDVLTPPETIYNVNLPPGCGLHLFANDYSPILLDDCTSEDDFDFSLQEEFYQPDSFYDPCDVPYGVVTTLDIWMADAGVDTDCNGSIIWTERNRYKHTANVIYHDQSGGGCLDCLDEITIKGHVVTKGLFEPVELVQVMLSSPGQLYPSYTTDKDGEYTFFHILVPTDVTISAERNDNHKNGVSTLDLVKIQKHLLGIEILNSPYDLIAADANNSQSVSAIDLIEIRKLILGRYNEFPNNKSWRFLDRKYDFQDTLNPGASPATITLFVTNNVTDADFIAIKIGDINNTVDANLQTVKPRNDPSTFFTVSGLLPYQPGEMVNFQLSTKAFKALEGFQFTISDPNLEFISASSDLIDLLEDDYASFDDQMTFSWFTTNPLDIISGQPILTIHARAKNAGSASSLQLTSAITDAELYSAGETYLPKLTFEDPQEESLILFPTEPNPWAGNTEVPFYTSQDGVVMFSVTNVAGQEVYTIEKHFLRGYHQFNLNAADFAESGLLFFTLQNESETRSGKMVKNP